MKPHGNQCISRTPETSEILFLTLGEPEGFQQTSEDCALNLEVLISRDR